MRVNPKPVRDRRIPVVVGGNGDAALARVAAFGDGWYGFNVPAAAVAERVAALAEQCRLRGRDPRELTVAVALADGGPGALLELARIGVTELVLVAAPPGWTRPPPRPGCGSWQPRYWSAPSSTMRRRPPGTQHPQGLAQRLPAPGGAGDVADRQAAHHHVERRGRERQITRVSLNEVDRGRLTPSATALRSAAARLLPL